MGANRIRIAKDKADLVQALTVSKDTTGPFQTYADVVVFAATLGAQKNRRIPLGTISKKEPAPIGLEIFVSRGYDLVLKLIAIAVTKDTKIISPSDNVAQEKRIRIFEEYANGGLEILRDELRGAVDYSEQLLLLLSAERFKEELTEDSFDLSRFL
ncbi:MAG: DNA phosphorothioation-associated protein 4 [Symploca sp. SIO2G7]|nr:DNA phosphorothioation-associated protein 4 [Symploca sp. SIO2G7]